MLGVSADAGVAPEVRGKYKLPFPLLSDPDRKVMTAYGAYGEKMMYGKKTMGVIRSTVWIGPDGKVRKHWARVAKAEAHPDAGARRAAVGWLIERRAIPAHPPAHLPAPQPPEYSRARLRRAFALCALNGL